MEIIQLLPLVYQKFVLFMLIFTRITGLFTTFVLFKRELITGRMIVALIAILSLYALLANNQTLIHFELFSISMLIHSIFQFTIGFMAGLILNIIFEIFVFLGQIISMQIGLGTASLIDPRFGVVTSLTHFYIILASLIFLYLNGHLFIIQYIMDSFEQIPIDQWGLSGGFFWRIIAYSSVMFSGSVKLALTVIVVLLTTNIALAIMSKFAPQFNLFTIGINLQLILGLICIYMIFGLMAEDSVLLINDCLAFLQHVFTGSVIHGR